MGKTRTTRADKETMTPTTVYAIIHDGKLALYDYRLPLFWKRALANRDNMDRLNGEGFVVQVTVRKSRKTRKAIVAALFCFLCASSAFAGDLKLPSAVFISAQSADVLTTHAALSSGRGVEANRVMVGSDAKRIALKAITTTGTLYLTSKLAVNHPKLAQGFLYSASAVVGAVAMQNYARTR